MSKSPQRSWGIIVWSAAAVFTVLLFAVISWTTLTTWFVAPTAPPAASPAATMSATGIEVSTPITAGQVTGEVAAPANATAQMQADLMAVWVSAISTITALLGLLATVYFGLRRERRETAQSAAELQKTQLEVELLKRQLEELGAPDSSA